MRGGNFWAFFLIIQYSNHPIQTSSKCTISFSLTRLHCSIWLWGITRGFPFYVHCSQIQSIFPLQFLTFSNIHLGEIQYSHRTPNKISNSFLADDIIFHWAKCLMLLRNFMLLKNMSSIHQMKFKSLWEEKWLWRVITPGSLSLIYELLDFVAIINREWNIFWKNYYESCM